MAHVAGLGGRAPERGGARRRVGHRDQPLRRIVLVTHYGAIGKRDCKELAHFVVAVAGSRILL